MLLKPKTIAFKNNDFLPTADEILFKLSSKKDIMIQNFYCLVDKIYKKTSRVFNFIPFFFQQLKVTMVVAEKKVSEKNKQSKTCGSKTKIKTKSASVGSNKAVFPKSKSSSRKSTKTKPKTKPKTKQVLIGAGITAVALASLLEYMRIRAHSKQLTAAKKKAVYEQYNNELSDRVGNPACIKSIAYLKSLLEKWNEKMKSVNTDTGTRRQKYSDNEWGNILNARAVVEENYRKFKEAVESGIEEIPYVYILKDPGFTQQIDTYIKKLKDMESTLQAIFDYYVSQK